MPRTQTHRMFYEALVKSNVPTAKALTMYYAVMVGARMWIDLMEGSDCTGISNCIQSTTGQLTIPNSTIKKVENKLQAHRPARFNDPAVGADIPPKQE